VDFYRKQSQSCPAESDATPFEEVCILFHVASSQKTILFPCRNSHFKDILLFDTITNLLIILLLSQFSAVVNWIKTCGIKQLDKY